MVDGLISSLKKMLIAVEGSIPIDPSGGMVWMMVNGKTSLGSGEKSGNSPMVLSVAPFPLQLINNPTVTIIEMILSIKTMWPDFFMVYILSLVVMTSYSAQYIKTCITKK